MPLCRALALPMGLFERSRLDRITKFMNTLIPPIPDYTSSRPWVKGDLHPKFWSVDFQTLA
jgi:hypothetical protein